MRISLVVAALLLGVAFSGCGEDSPPATESAPPNLLLVTLDTLRADHLGCYGSKDVKTPHLDRAAAEGALFLNTTAPSPLTLPSHASLLTGNYPPVHGVRDNMGFTLPEEATTLAEILTAQGYSTAGFISAFVLNAGLGIAQGFERYSDHFEYEAGEHVRTGADTVDRAIHWLDNRDSRPFCLWVHLFEPHQPYEPPQPFQRQYNHDPYAGEVAYTDALVGRLVQALEERGQLDNTLLVLVGDHGEGRGEHQEKYHGLFIYESTTQVPFILRGPGVPARTIPAQTSLVDILPTTLDLLGLKGPESISGQSLLPLINGEKEDLHLAAYSESYYPNIHYGWSELKSLRTGRYKYIRAPREELYDLQEDPREKNNLAEQEPDLCRRLRNQLAELEKRLGNAPVQPESVDARTSEALARLGYAGTVAEPPSGESLDDPKDKADLLLKKEEAEQRIAAGDPFHAILLLQEVVAREPRMIDALIGLGTAHYLARQYEEAQEIFDRTARLAPDRFEVWTNLGSVQRAQGNEAESIPFFERAFELNPYREDLLQLLAELYLDASRFQDCETACRRYLREDPRALKTRFFLATALLAQGRNDQARQETAAAREIAEDLLKQEPTSKTARQALEDLKKLGFE